jgi:hypothetical protein
MFLFTTASRPALGPTQPPIQWVPGMKLPGREVDHSYPFSAEVKNTWRYTSTLPYVFMAWCLVKHRDNFTFNFYLTPQTSGVHLALFAVRQISAKFMFSGSCKAASLRWSRDVSTGTKISEAKIRAIYFCHQRKPIEARLKLNEPVTPFVDHIKYLGVIFHKTFTWRLYRNDHH